MTKNQKVHTLHLLYALERKVHNSVKKKKFRTNLSDSVSEMCIFLTNRRIHSNQFDLFCFRCLLSSCLFPFLNGSLYCSRHSFLTTILKMIIVFKSEEERIAVDDSIDQSR